MKKFYAFSLMAAAVLSANAFGNATVAKFDKAPIAVNVDVNKTIDMKRVEAIRANHHSQMSRDAADLTALDIQYYYSYFDKCWMSNLCSVTENADGTVTVHNFLGYEGWDFEGEKDVAKTSTGETVEIVVVPMGQQFPNNNYRLELFTVNEDGDLDYESDFTFVVEDDELWPTQYYLGAGAYDKTSGEYLGIYDLTQYIAIRKSNCTISYQQGDINQAASTVDYSDFSTRGIYEIYQETDEDGNGVVDADGNPVLWLELTGINALEGMQGAITKWEIDQAEMTATALDQVIYPSLSVSQTEETGDFMMISVDDETLEFGDAEVLGAFDGDENGLTGFVFGSWIPYTESNYWFSYYAQGPCVVEFDQKGGAGVSNVAVDNTNAPVEIYNLSGQKVSNPVAGQVYIVKQGTSVKKMIKK